MSGPRGRDIVIISLSFLVTAVAAVGLFLDHHPGAAWTMAVVGLLGTVSLWWRRRFPLTVLGLGVAVVVLSTNPIPICFGLMRIAILGRNRLLAVCTVVAPLALFAP